MLAGDLIARALLRRGPKFTFDLDAPPLTLAEFDQGGTDPGNIVEFLALEIDFDIEPATGLIFPPEAHRG
ncbi:MAG TPA: hypothetical protein VJ927_10790 [Actinomycetota bacterium]|nr:hypothetical protein [Actinomycetota bacterium]